MLPKLDERVNDLQRKWKGCIRDAVNKDLSYIKQLDNNRLYDPSSFQNSSEVGFFISELDISSVNKIINSNKNENYKSQSRLLVAEDNAGNISGFAYLWDGSDWEQFYLNSNNQKEKIQSEILSVYRKTIGDNDFFWFERIAGVGASAPLLERAIHEYTDKTGKPTIDQVVINPINLRGLEFHGRYGGYIPFGNIKINNSKFGEIQYGLFVHLPK